MPLNADNVSSALAPFLLSVDDEERTRETQHVPSHDVPLDELHTRHHLLEYEEVSHEEERAVNFGRPQTDEV